MSPRQLGADDIACVPQFPGIPRARAAESDVVRAVRFMKLDNDQRRLSNGAHRCSACKAEGGAGLLVVRRADFIKK